MLVYIAGPYTKGDVAVNVWKAIQTANRLLGIGYTPYIPHLTHFWHIITPKHYQEWLNYDTIMLRRCDCVLRIPGESDGADKEVALAKSLGMTVYYDIKDMP